VDVRSLDWDRLKIFQAVAEEGSISAAALKLAVSPAKISRDIEELEHSLAQELFIRSKRGMELTDVGGVVLKSARSMAESAKALSSNIDDVAAGTTTKVVIAAHDAVATYWLARHLPEFHRLNPRFEVMVKVVHETPNVANGDADIAIQYEAPTAPNVIARQLGWLHYILYATPSYLDIYGVPETMFDLGRHRFILHSAYNKQVELWEQKTPAWLEVLTSSLQSNSSTVILETCANDGGIALMPTYVSEFERRIKALVNIRPLASIRFWLTYSERVRTLNRYEPVLAWLRECFNPDVHPCFREGYIAPGPERMAFAS
jgi:DNA-binding transcriptional LysR family regulator